jgi:hypothetical protein
MATFDFTLTDADIGTVLPVPNGFLVSLIKTQAPPPGAGELPQWDAGRMRWKAGRFALKASGDHRCLVSIALTDTIPGKVWAQNASIGYTGDLEVQCMPKGSTWSLTLSDVPNVRAPMPPCINFTGSNYRPVNPPAAPKEPAPRPLSGQGRWG